MFSNETIVTKIILAVFFPGEGGRPILKDRPTHGLVLNVGCTSEYIFENGQRLTCRSGECIYLPKGSNYTANRYGISNTKDSGIYAINFLTLPENEKNTPWVMRIKPEHEIQILFFKAAKTWTKKDVGYHEECLSCLYQILKQIKKETYGRATEKHLAALLAPALEYIDEHYASASLSVPQLAALCGISEVHLRRSLQRAFSLSPAIYVRNKRIAYAKELLLSEEYSVTEVAFLAGFNDAAYFAREFKKAVGVTPSMYRKEME